LADFIRAFFALNAVPLAAPDSQTDYPPPISVRN
jgi:hypothetical protein